MFHIKGVVKGLACFVFFWLLLFQPELLKAKKAIILNDLEFIEFTGSVMQVNVFDGFLIVAEKKVVVVFEIGSRFYRTPLENKNQKRIRLLSFDRGDKVLVKGVRFPDGLIAASYIQNLSAY